MNTLEYLQRKYDLTLDNKKRMPVEIPNVGRATLANWLHELDFKTAVEVGVAAGDYSEVLCKTNPQMKIYGVDPYIPLEGYRDYARPSTFEKFRAEAKARLAAYSNYEFIYKPSMEAAKDFADSSLDFVYIDANHEKQFVIDDITQWYRKIKPGGIVAGHDYSVHKTRDDMSPHHQVREAVRVYTDDNDIKLWFVLGNMGFKDGQIRDNPRSWMWVKA